MALLARTVDFSDRDFDSLRLRLQKLVRSVFPDWTDFNVANFGNLLLELYAFLGDVLTFYQDSQARESRIVTATQRKNVIALAKLLGYKLAGAKAATANERFTLAEPPAGDVTFPAGTKVRTQEVTERVEFTLLAALTIPAGADPPMATGTVENSEPRDELFDSTGEANQELVLTFSPFLDGSAEVTAGNGAFAAVDSFLDSGPNDIHFTVLVDQNDRATIRFGDGLQGAIPTGTIQVIYKTGGGPQGNVDAGRIVVIDGSFTDTFGNPVKVTVTNPASASGGKARQSLESARVLAPASLRTLTRTVSREDYENNALRLAEVARALMLTSNEDASIAENSGILRIIPQGGGIPSQVLKDSVLNQVTVVYPNTLTFVVDVQNPVYRTVDVAARVFLRAGANANDVRARILAALTDFFSISQSDGTPNPNVDFGFNLRDAEGGVAGDIAWSDVFALVQQVTGVRKIGDGEQDFLLNGESDDVFLAIEEFPVLGTVTLSNGDTGGPL